MSERSTETTSGTRVNEPASGGLDVAQAGPAAEAPPHTRLAWLHTVMSPVGRQILIGALVVATIVVLANMTRAEAYEQSAQWLQHLRYTDSASVAHALSTLPATVGTLDSTWNSVEKQRLQEQMREITRRARYHVAVMEYFYARNFTLHR